MFIILDLEIRIWRSQSLRLAFAFFTLLHHLHLHHRYVILTHAIVKFRIVKNVETDEYKMDVVSLIALNPFLLQLVNLHITILITFLSYWVWFQNANKHGYFCKLDKSCLQICRPHGVPYCVQSYISIVKEMSIYRTPISESTTKTWSTISCCKFMQKRWWKYWFGMYQIGYWTDKWRQ